MADDFGSMWGLERRRGGTLSSSPLQGRWLVAGLLLVSGLIGVVNINAIPPDAHEVYVLVSAQQMRERGDWIVPYFQGEPRLAKPPLNYWLTAVAAELSGSEYVEPWHGRVPSVLGA